MSNTYDALLNWIDIAHNSDLGYDQNQRMSFLDLQNHRIRPHSETDCSALVLGLYDLAGYPINMTPPVYTGTVRSKLTAFGATAIPIRGWSVAQIQARATMGGAVVVNEVHHVIIQSRNIGTWLSANIDENGNAAGGRAGNQTGNEVSFRPLWMYSHGWDYLIIPPDYKAGTSASGMTSTQLAQLQPQQKITLNADALKVLQTKLGVTVDGVLGAQTVAAWQKRMNTPADGVVNDPSTLVSAVQTALNTFHNNLTAQSRTVGAEWEILTVDGEWGPKTQAATESYLLHWNGGFGA